MATLQPGDKAPAFSGKDRNGTTISLKDFKGKRVALVFYPEDDSPLCTVQVCNLRDNYSMLKKQGFEVIGVSPDDEASHRHFENKFNLPFILLSDPDHIIMDKYGVWAEKQMFGNKFMGVKRNTFVIDEEGIIRKIILRPKTTHHAGEIVKVFDKKQ
jgi:thioredoxin-dependent peroxiredoxin